MDYLNGSSLHLKHWIWSISLLCIGIFIALLVVFARDPTPDSIVDSLVLPTGLVTAALCWFAGCLSYERWATTTSRLSRIGRLAIHARDMEKFEEIATYLDVIGAHSARSSLVKMALIREPSFLWSTEE